MTGKSNKWIVGLLLYSNISYSVISDDHDSIVNKLHLRKNIASFQEKSNDFTRVFTVPSYEQQEFGIFSNEINGGYSEVVSSPIIGVKCSGKYCDDKQLTAGTKSVFSDVKCSGPYCNDKQLNSGTWTSLFTNGPEMVCAPNKLIKQIQCANTYCMRMRFLCQTLKNGYRVISDEVKRVGPFSNEDGYDKCPEGYYLAGMHCTGAWCNNIELICHLVEEALGLPRPPFTGKFTSQRELKIAVKTWVNNKNWAITKYGHISDWDVSQVTSMRCLFSGWRSCSDDRFDGKSDDEMRYKMRRFNEDLSKWNVGKVTNMYSMFNVAMAFNSDISKWDVRNVKNCENMFYAAYKFKQNICSWIEKMANDVLPENIGCNGKLADDDF